MAFSMMPLSFLSNMLASPRWSGGDGQASLRLGAGGLGFCFRIDGFDKDKYVVVAMDLERANARARREEMSG
ncbi:hypothetical protein BI343_16645 [Chromobacterium amazonense]|nr:hypothetical protein BI343_16645 [Chromobacterium amazonense]